jgi:hypothetical protein
VRVKVFMAALVAAALMGGGTAACAMTASNSAWLETSDAYHDNLTTPNLPYLVGTSRLAPGGPDAALDSPFAYSAASPAGLISASGTSVALAAPRLAGSAANSRLHALRNFDLVDSVAGGFAFDLGYDFDQGRRFAATDVRGQPAFAGLFVGPSDFNGSGFGESGFHAGASLPLGNGFSLNFGGSESGPDRGLLEASLAPYPVPDTGLGFGEQQSGSVLAGVGWKFAPWASFDVTGAHDTARAAFAGGEGGALSLAKASSDTVGASAKVALGKGWVTSFNYNEGVRQLDLKPGVNLAPEAGRSRSYGVAVAKHGLFGDDSLGIAVSRPLNLEPGGIGLGTAPVDPFDGFISANTHPILGGQSSETDLQLGYVTTFLDGALALQANAGYQMNAQGQPGTNGVTVLSRAKINF